MRAYLIPSLLAANLLLAGGLAWQWVTPQGQLRSVRWVPPAPVKPVLGEPALPTWSADLGSFMAALDRPLFSATRKPPPPPAPAAPVVVDTLADARVLGLYSSGGAAGGAILWAEGKERRVRQGDPLAGWTVKEIRPQGVLLVRGNEKRTLDFRRGSGVVADTPGRPGAAPPAAPVSTSAGGDLLSRQQKEAAAGTARVNAMRARAGLPTLP